MIGDTEKVVPVIDCPICGAKDVPLSLETAMTKEGSPDIEIWSCSKCGKVPNVAEDIKVKRWLSTRDLEAMGYTEERV